MFYIKNLFFVFTVFVFCESAFVDNLGKCAINDGNCEKKLIQTALVDICKVGIPELDIPKLDPMELNNLTISVLDLLDITLVRGTFKGIKDCVVDKFTTSVENEHAIMEMTCDALSVKGRYKVSSSSPVIKTLFQGQPIHGEGNGKVKIEKLHLKFDYFFFVQRRNGKIYIKCKYDKTIYSYDIKGKMTFAADNIYIGNQESSQLATGLLNENWKMIMTSFGKQFMDKAMEIVYVNLHNFFDNVPASYYISDDLSSFARDEI